VRLVIKVGGTVLENRDSCAAIAQQLADIAREHELVVVHGGGKQVTRYLDERGVTSRFVNGLRVSDGPVIDAVTHVIAGSLNKRLVSAIIAAGESAVGLSGVDGALTPASQLDASLGFVGNPGRTDSRLLDLLVNAGYVPVVACIAGDRDGNIYNVNADQMAVSCAIGWRAENLFFLTDVHGVRAQDGNLLPHICLDEISALTASGVAHGGMQAKLEATAVALRAGIAEVAIAHGREPGICRRLIFGEAHGTRLSRLALPDRSVTA
jgi:acetylglutamate kinase